MRNLIVSGFVANTPSCHNLEEGAEKKPFATFTLASQEFGEKEPTYFRCIAFNHLPKFLNNNVEKGDKITVVANRIEAKSYRSNLDDAFRTYIEITVSEIDWHHHSKKNEGKKEEESLPPTVPNEEFSIPENLNEQLPWNK